VPDEVQFRVREAISWGINEPADMFSTYSRVIFGSGIFHGFR
jgi:hypothetical protein